MLRTLSRPALLALLGLAVGAALGAWGMRLYFDRTLRQWDPTERFVARLGQELDLDGEQRERVALVLSEQRARMELRRQAWRIEVRGLAREGEDQIGRILRPPQAARFVGLRDEIHGRMDRYLWASENAPSAIAIGAPER